MSKAEFFSDLGNIWSREMWMSLESILGLLSQLAMLLFILILIFLYVFTMLSCCTSICCESPPMSMNSCSWPVENMGPTYIINSDIVIGGDSQHQQPSEEPHREPPPSYDEVRLSQLEYNSVTATEDIYPDCPPPYADPKALHNANRPETEDGSDVEEEERSDRTELWMSAETNLLGADAEEDLGESSRTNPTVRSLKGDVKATPSETPSKRTATQV